MGQCNTKTYIIINFYAKIKTVIFNRLLPLLTIHGN